MVVKKASRYSNVFSSNADAAAIMWNMFMESDTNPKHWIYNPDILNAMQES
jgi:hypothetical protein